MDTLHVSSAIVPEPGPPPFARRHRFVKRLLRLTFMVGLPLVFIPVLLTKKAAARRLTEPEPSTASGANTLVARERTIQGFVDRIKTQLLIPEDVLVSIVPADKLVVSVARMLGREGTFSLSFEAGFLDGLTQDELEAVIAHELGHVWIFTHHPYLQTEEGANRVAMRVARRETLESVYEKVWKLRGARSEIAYLPPAK